MSVSLFERHGDTRKVVIRCGVGCLHHVIGITWFSWSEGDPDEPELYFETLHEPWEGFWKRCYRAFRFVFHREPMGVDSTVVTRDEAQKIIDACVEYQEQWDGWHSEFKRGDRLFRPLPDKD